MQPVLIHIEKPDPQTVSPLAVFNVKVDRFESDEREPALRKWLRASGKIN